VSSCIRGWTPHHHGLRVPGDCPLLGGPKGGDKSSTHICPPHLSGVLGGEFAGSPFGPILSTLTSSNFMNKT